MTMLRPPPTKPITLPCQRGFSRGGKKEEYVKPRTKERGQSYEEIGAYDCGCNSGSPLGDAVKTLKKKTSAFGAVYYRNYDNPSAKLYKLIRLTACKKAGCNKPVV